METVWFCLVAVMIALYVVLDGFDLGAGAIHLLVAKTESERRVVLRSIGPVWDGNEVWLLAAGGTLYFAFPALYASSFSGFYLPLMIVLWLLILRGISIEFRNQIASPLWISFWDVTFSFSSLLLAVFYGAALGNVVRGVPLNANGYFFEALWTNFRLGGETGILDWYTIVVGVAALAALVLHGALWVAMKTEGRVNERARRLARPAWWATALLTILVTVLTFRVQPHVPASLFARPWGYVFPLLALAGLVSVRWFLAREDDVKSFLASCAYIVGMLTSVVFGLYPLTIENAKAGDYGLRIGLVWWIIGMILCAGYFVFTYRHFAGKVRPDSETEGY
jgi:cytochrome d ubiquinol oxidase subunit II